jgi:hypothetical protein
MYEMSIVFGRPLLKIPGSVGEHFVGVAGAQRDAGVVRSKSRAKARERGK